MEKYYFYIAIALFWVVRNWYKSANRKPANQPEQPNGRGQKSIETILEEILVGKKEPNQTSSKPIVKKDRTRNFLPEAQGKEVVENNLFSYDSDPKKNETMKDAPITLFSEEAEGERMDFDVKTAIIYAEIMAPPKSVSEQ